MGSGNLSTKTLVIDAGINDSQLEQKTLALYHDLLTELNQNKHDKSWFEADGKPELNFITANNNPDAKNNLKITKKYLESSHLVFLIGDTNDIRFWQVRKITIEKIKAGSYPSPCRLVTATHPKVSVATNFGLWI